MLDDFADTLQNHQAVILAYYDNPISTGPLEGTNDKIKKLQKQSHGSIDMDFFKLKFFSLHETNYTLVG